MPALQPHDHAAMSAGARRWLREHPGIPAGRIDRIRRLVEPDACHAFSVLTMVAMKARLGSLGGCIPEPCNRCGEWTHAYCESCVLQAGPPKPICTTCDEARVVCAVCQGQGRSWEVGRAEHEERIGARRDLLEVNGYHDESGEYTQCDPPLQIDIHDLDPGMDGIIYTQELMSRIQAAVEARHQHG